MVGKANGMDNQQPSRFSESYAEGSTIMYWASYGMVI
jgi:hypothetical protein